MRFARKWGQPGWPGPQAQRLEQWCERWQIEYDYTIAETGTRYYTLDAPDGSTLRVRISDHNDLYGNADLSWDPYNDCWHTIKQWICLHGIRPIRWGVTLASKLAIQLRRALPQYEVHVLPGLEDPLIQVTDTQYVLAFIDRRGLFVEGRCPQEVKAVICKIVPKQFQRDIADE